MSQIARKTQSVPPNFAMYISGFHSPGYCVAIPLWNKYIDGIDNGSDSNISTYLMDAGLWTACHESRLMMQESFLHAQWRYESWTEHYISGGAPLYITIRYRKDLVILQLDSLDFEKWDDEKWGRVRYLRNIGIEYRPDWCIVFNKEEEEGNGAWEVDAFDKIYCFGEALDSVRIWIIDHNLRRKVDALPCDEKRGQGFWSTENVSFYGADRKFSSTGLGKGGDRLAHWEYINPVADGEHRKFSLYFADRLYDLYKELLDWATRGTGTISALLGWDRL
ncbi:hypothetical protein FACUT_1857 [Fusarium acutatum]|uniref:Uncharacterized protein n=1 Tax=Fusarium acutatum TaxID=78861 RepID=A0A8H4NLI3_9HYPO|nr:hypothetical protein FACUT_1857 [Fusarium acutatum]